MLKIFNLEGDLEITDYAAILQAVSRNVNEMFKQGNVWDLRLLFQGFITVKNVDIYCASAQISTVWKHIEQLGKAKNVTLHKTVLKMVPFFFFFVSLCVFDVSVLFLLALVNTTLLLSILMIELSKFALMSKIRCMDQILCVSQSFR